MRECEILKRMQVPLRTKGLEQRERLVDKIQNCCWIAVQGVANFQAWGSPPGSLTSSRRLWWGGGTTDWKKPA
jgi:hypothetical protein